MGKLKACVSLLHVGRVHNKPYRELKDSNDRPDEEVAREVRAHLTPHILSADDIGVAGQVWSICKCRSMGPAQAKPGMRPAQVHSDNGPTVCLVWRYDLSFCGWGLCCP